MACLKAVFATDACMSNNSLGLIAQVKKKYEISTQSGDSNKAQQPINPFLAMVKTGSLVVESAMTYWTHSTKSSMQVMLNMSWAFFVFKSVLTAAAAATAACER